MHKLSQDAIKRFQIVDFEQEEFKCNYTPKTTITYSSYETRDKNSENSLANDDRNMNMVLNESTVLGLSNGSNPNLLSAAVMVKISKNTSKPPVQCHLENYKNPENSSQNQPSVSFLPQHFPSSQVTAENGGHCSLKGNDTKHGCDVVSESLTEIISNNAHDANRAFR